MPPKLLFVAAALTAAAVACSSSPSSNDTSSAPYGCCPIGDSPPATCDFAFGRAKRSATDMCEPDSFDGPGPDTSQPGWTKVTDADGCPTWHAPANPKMVICGAADASTD